MIPLRIGIVGLGVMGAQHAKNILAGKIPALRLGALADVDPARHGIAPGVPAFSSGAALIDSGLVDAVLIATPHFDHVPLGIRALEAGLHVLVEKPIAVQKIEADRLLAAYAPRAGRQIFGVVFNQRTNPQFQRIRRMVLDGELGALRRVNWTVTHWYRTAAYYGSGGWRATWGGEGGGVLLNQLPHHLDLFQWMFGMPVRVRAHCGFGRYHDIEVEDDVTAYMEFADGKTATIIASTGEAPGTNRLEIAGENGRLVCDNDVISFTRNAVPMSEFSRTSPQPFARPDTVNVPVEVSGTGGQHVDILQNFADAILNGAPLLAPATEGIRSVELANAMLLSTWLDRTISLPLDAAEYERELNRRIATSRYRRSENAAAAAAPAR